MKIKWSHTEYFIKKEQERGKKNEEQNEQIEKK